MATMEEPGAEDRGRRAARQTRRPACRWLHSRSSPPRSARRSCSHNRARRRQRPWASQRRCDSPAGRNQSPPAPTRSGSASTRRSTANDKADSQHRLRRRHSDRSNESTPAERSSGRCGSRVSSGPPCCTSATRCGSTTTATRTAPGPGSSTRSIGTPASSSADSRSTVASSPSPTATARCGSPSEPRPPHSFASTPRPCGRSASRSSSRPGASFGSAFGSGAVWATGFDDGSLARVDPATGRVDRIKLGGAAAGVIVSGGSVWIALYDRSMVIRVDPRTLRVLHTTTRRQQSGLPRRRPRPHLGRQPGRRYRDAHRRSHAAKPSAYQSGSRADNAITLALAGRSLWVTSDTPPSATRIDLNQAG